MPRSRSFDPDRVLAAAQRVFHTRGYEGTSVQDLVDATGLGRSSLYHAYGDKHGLFLAVLDRYVEAGERRAEDWCDGGPPLAVIRALLEAAARPASPDAPGCLLVNATAERASVDPDTADRADRVRTAQHDRFERLVRDAQASGAVASERSASDLARLLSTVAYGLRGLQTAGADADELATVVDGAVDAITSEGASA